MASPQVPKYQAIHAVLRQRILDGEYRPGARLPPQQELATSFDVTLMTLRQAIAALESEGLVWAARGKGTFVAEEPVDIRFDNLSSFADQMRSAGIEVQTEVLAVEARQRPPHPAAARALGTSDPLTCVTRRRSTATLPFSVQRSWFVADAIPVAAPDDLGDASLYDTFAAAAGWSVTNALESITAVALGPEDADLLAAEPGHPALCSIRTSIHQFGAPFLYDEAVLVGGRASITADRTSNRLSLRYGTATEAGG